MKKLHRSLVVSLTAVLTLVLALVVLTGEAKTPATDPLAKPAGVDLDVTLISRAPLYHRYQVWYTAENKPYLAPGTENDQRWPAHGEVVTFTAHVINKGTAASGAFAFAWSIDGSVVATGTQASLAPGAEITKTYPWTWDHTVVDERLTGEHTVAFEVDPDDLIAETYESNNRLADRTDALSLRLALTSALYDALETPVDPQWPYSAEDWLQKQIAAMNEAFADSVYPGAPTGVTERVRLDQILITESPPPADLQRDGSFYMTGDDRYGNAYYHADTDVSGALIHELTHQLGIIDTYNLDVALETPQVLDGDGDPVQMEYWPELPGLMGNAGIDPPIYSEHTALALNANKGYRRGYYGEYLYDVPPTTTLRVLDNEGQPAPGVTVRFFQSAPSPNMLGGRHGVIDNAPEITVTTGATGTAVLPNRDAGDPVTTRTGHTLEDNPFGVINVVGRDDEFLVEIASSDHQEYRWLDITTFNLAAWYGKDAITLTTHVPPAAAPAPPVPLTGTQAYGQVSLAWAPSPGATAYHIYRTTGGTYSWQRVVTGATALSATLPYPIQQRAAGYAVTAVDSSGTESGFGDLFWALRLRYPADLVVRDDGQRLVLDPQNGYALLLQSAEDDYVDTLGSFDLHLEYSHYLAPSLTGGYLVSHPGDWYQPRHSVRVLDPDANLRNEFGQWGSGDGQFRTPAGVTAWLGSAISPNHPPPILFLVADSGNHRLQAFDPSGDFITAYGSQGAALGQFNNPQGLAVLPTNEVVVVDSGNNRLQVLAFDGATFTPVRQILADFNAPSHVTTYGSDRLIVADQGNNAIKILDATGTLYATHTAPDAGYGGAFNNPHGVAVDKASGRILVADTGNQRVVAISDALPAEPPTDLTVEGPGIAEVGTTYPFTAAVSPADATLPLTYTWQATDQPAVSHARSATTDTVAFTWTVSGTKRITVTAANKGGAVTRTKTVLIDPPHHVHLPLVMRNQTLDVELLYFRSDVDIANPGQTIQLEWASAGATGAGLYNLLPSYQFGSFWEVKPNGTFFYTIPESRRNWDAFHLSVYNDAGQTAEKTLFITLTCPDEWFFEPAPDSCPAGPAVYSGGAEQHFEHGIMLWVQSEDRIYVLYNDGQIPAWQAFPDEWAGDPDPILDPPPGYYQPKRGFGLVWREQPNVRDRLGWGTTPEQGYETAFQRSSAWKYPHTYIKAANSGTWHLKPERSEWEYIP